MSETEMLKQKIRDLEAEVQQLKEALPKEKAPKRSLCPKEVAEKHGGLMKKGIAWEYNHFPYMDSADLTGLSRIIRRCCFSRSKKSRNEISADGYSYRTKNIKYDTGKTLKDLTDEEYAKYSEVLDKILDIFQEYGCTSNNNY
jgi:hypothetical protein